jgi:hypothetical protein
MVRRLRPCSDCNVWRALLRHRAARRSKLFSASEAAAWNAHNPNDRAAYSARDLHAPGVPSCHDIPASSSQSELIPQIKIVAPTLGKPLAAPLDIELQFLPVAKRITDHVTLSAQGLHVAGAQLPHGHHHLVMLIADQRGQIGSRDAIFDIL